VILARCSVARVLWLAIAVLGVGCATAPQGMAPREEVLSGRLAMRVEATATDPARSVSSAFDLRGSSQQGQLDLSTPLGTLVARARWRPGRAVLTTTDREVEYTDLDAMSAAALGETIPVAALFDWLHGRPWNGAPSRPTPDGFEQLGWSVDTTRLDEGVISARRHSSPTVTFSARLERPL
jgi:outer membrane lipoprotein LolB